jgi:hypothetical protein
MKEERLITYIRLLDAAAEDADWREVAKIVLHIDPGREPERAFKSWESHLARARWMTTDGYRYLLAEGAPQLIAADRLPRFAESAQWFANSPPTQRLHRHGC